MTKFNQTIPKMSGRIYLCICIVIFVFIGRAGLVQADVNPPSIGANGAVPHKITRTSVGYFTATIDPEGAETTWRLEYAENEKGTAPPENSAAWKEVPGGSGTLPKPDGIQEVITGELGGLNVETIYSVRIKATNAVGDSEEINEFETTPLRPDPEFTNGNISNVTTTSAHLEAVILPRESETHWHFEYATSKSGPWNAVAGAEGVILKTEAGEEFLSFPADLINLQQDTVYYVRLFAENEPEVGVHRSATSQIIGFETAGAPAVQTFAIHAIHGEEMRALGLIESHAGPIDELQDITVGGGATGGTFTLSFAGEVTSPIPFNATAGTVEGALGELPAVIRLLANTDTLVRVSGSAGGPYSVNFSFGPGTVGMDEPQIVADGSNLVPSGSVSVTTVQNGGPGYETRYHAEYVTQEEFERSGFTKAQATSQVDLGPSKRPTSEEFLRFATNSVGDDLPGLQPGVTYHYRLVATNTSPGDPVVNGSEAVLTVPIAAESSEVACPNQALRYGASSRLSDCRAYEQVTPREKGSAQDTFRYGLIFEDGRVGEDGEHVELHVPGVQWGLSPDAGESNYFFTRGENGWTMTSGTPQPAAGINRYLPTVFSSDLTEIGVAVSWTTSSTVRSPSIEFVTGRPGGPYAVAAVVPRTEVPSGAGWVAASADAHQLILAVEDHTLLGHGTGTISGTDLYEYSNGKLTQVNVLGPSPGAPISTCGATIVSGEHIGISADGVRVLFVDNCTHDLYMRVNDAETVDIGPYAFIAADGAGSRLMLRKRSGNVDEYFIYESKTGVVSPIGSVPNSGGALTAIASGDLSTLYFDSKERLTPDAPTPSEETSDVYSYDVSSGTMHFVAEAEPGPISLKASPDDRYLYLTSRGISGSGIKSLTPTMEVYRYGKNEKVIECITCASPFQPEPYLGSEIPAISTSSNGDYVFFDTVAALVPQDVDGEVAPEPIKLSSGEFSEHPSNLYSTSSDVYEWRSNGVDGCNHIQGCLSLVSSGRGGFKNVLLGATPSGRDVFFATHEKLVAQDLDSAGDVYDARIGGGYPPPQPRPVECEGDACQSPLAAPVDTTPASLTFSGPGNIASTLPVKHAVAKTCRKGTARKRGKCVKRKSKSVKKVRSKKVGRSLTRVHGGRK